MRVYELHKVHTVIHKVILEILENFFSCKQNSIKGQKHQNLRAARDCFQGCSPVSKCCKKKKGFTVLPFFLMGHQVRGFKESPDTKVACIFTEENLPQDINRTGFFFFSLFFWLPTPNCIHGLLCAAVVLCPHSHYFQNKRTIPPLEFSFMQCYLMRMKPFQKVSSESHSKPGVGC